MIIEKRKRIRNTKPTDIDWVSEFNFYESGNWDEYTEYRSEIIPWQIVLAFALLTGVSAFVVCSSFC
jgi:hypothetical protein